MEERTYGDLKLSLNEIDESGYNNYNSGLKALAAHIRELLAENAALKADAARYQWLKANVETHQAIWIKDDPVAMGTANTAAWDEEIDEAMTK